MLEECINAVQWEVLLYNTVEGTLVILGVLLLLFGIVFIASWKERNDG